MTKENKEKFWVVIGVSIPLIFMIFLGDNSCSNVKKLEEEIEIKKNNLKIIEEKIQKVQKQIDEKDTPEGKEKIAREDHNFKKDNEDIYIIEFDSVNKK